MTGTALITGAAKRIGHALALHLAKSGWDIAIHYNMSRAEAEETAAAIRATGHKAYLVQADLMNAEAIQNLIPSLTATERPLTALVNNASLFERDENDPGGRRHRQINFTAPILLAEQLLKYLPPGETGCVVNILDATPAPNFLSAYAKSKNVLREAPLEMSRRMAPRVRVNALALGPVMKSSRQSPEHFKRMIEATPLGIEITPEVVAASVEFLLENPAITGQILYVDGGAHFSEFPLKK